jgi:RNA polymerase sigma-70 factor (ECF subfamily)
MRRRDRAWRPCAGWHNHLMQEVGSDTLMQAARGGDPDALEALLKQYQPQIYRFGMKMCRDREDAQDILQETLFAAVRTLQKFRGASSVSTWLYAIARSFCLKKRRRSASAPQVVSLESQAPEARTAPDTGPGPEGALAHREIAVALDSAIAALEPDYREVLVLRDVEGLPASEVAEVTGLSVAAVKSRLHRARAALRESLVPLLSPAPAARPSTATGICPDVVSLMSRHLEGEIGAETCAEMERHVAACPPCGAACTSLRQTLQLCGSTPSVIVPDAVQEAVRKGIRGILAERRA